MELSQYNLANQEVSMTDSSGTDRIPPSPGDDLPNDSSSDEGEPAAASESSPPGQGADSTEPEAPPGELAGSTRSVDSRPARSFSLRTAAIAAGSALLLGLVIGGIVGFVARPSVQTTSEYKALKSDLNGKLDESRDQNEVLSTEVDVANDKATAADARKADLDARDVALKKAEEQLKADQATLDAKTKQVQDSQFGDGVHLVGTNVLPGVYSISNGSNCYYAWMSGTGSGAAIVDNNIVSGPATVTLQPGEVFETNRCGTWTKVG